MPLTLLAAAAQRAITTELREASERVAEQSAFRPPMTRRFAPASGRCDGFRTEWMRLRTVAGGRTSPFVAGVDLGDCLLESFRPAGARSRRRPQVEMMSSDARREKPFRISVSPEGSQPVTMGAR